MNTFDAFIQLVGSATLQTLAMVALSTTFSLALGFPLGILLCVTDPAGIAPRPALNQVLSRVVNVLRSFPFIILMILL
ncbi:MAG TPA: methionine ABC transporter permease, partial [Treponemataceae bacterium]|nr:methionine ABC transporter permease [Treponemataceae bacterium]